MTDNIYVCYRNFTSTKVRLVTDAGLVILATVIKTVIGRELSATSCQLAMAVIFSSVVGIADYWMIGTIGGKNEATMNYLRTSARGSSLLENAIKGDFISRIIKALLVMAVMLIGSGIGTAEILSTLFFTLLSVGTSVFASTITRKSFFDISMHSLLVVIISYGLDVSMGLIYIVAELTVNKIVAILIVLFLNFVLARWAVKSVVARFTEGYLEV